jgi:hypothetical protein
MYLASDVLHETGDNNSNGDDNGGDDDDDDDEGGGDMYIWIEEVAAASE